MSITTMELTTLLQARLALEKMCKDPIGPEGRCLEELKTVINGLYEVALKTPLTFEWDTGDDESVTECFRPVPPEQIEACAKYFKDGLRAGASISDLKTALAKYQRIFADEDYDQTVYVEEECTELLKEICKFRRRKGNRKNLMEETLDVATACLVYHQVCGGDIESFLEQALYKVNRAIKRHEANGEM